MKFLLHLIKLFDIKIYITINKVKQNVIKKWNIYIK